MNEIAIKVENLSKRYRIGLKEKTEDTFVGAVGSILKSPLQNFKRLQRLTNLNDSQENSEDIIWALRDISFEVKKGEVIGIMGANGAGKSTLLKIIAQITHPTNGSVELNGRVASLLEVGTGFHPELTGRENIYLNGTILGMTKKEIDHKLEQIVDFSGVEKFLDTPIKKYSSGMHVRLAFSVAAHLDPEILLIDEVLAVGDAEFQSKCLEKMKMISRSGKTILFVSHNIHNIQSICKNGVLLTNGAASSVMGINKTISLYNNNLVNNKISKTNKNFSFLNASAIVQPTKLKNSKDLCIKIEIESKKPLKKVSIGFSIWTMDFIVRIFTCTSTDENIIIDINKGYNEVKCLISNLELVPGSYCIRSGIYNGNTGLPLIRKGWDDTPDIFSIDSPESEKINRKTFDKDLIIPNAQWST